MSTTSCERSFIFARGSILPEPDCNDYLDFRSAIAYMYECLFADR